MRRPPRCQNDDGVRWIVRAFGRDDVVARSRKQAEAIHARLMAAGHDAVLTVAHVVPQPYQAGNRLERRLPKSGVHDRTRADVGWALVSRVAAATTCPCERCAALIFSSRRVRRFGQTAWPFGVVVGRDDKVRQKVRVK